MRRTAHCKLPAAPIKLTDKVVAAVRKRQLGLCPAHLFEGLDLLGQVQKAAVYLAADKWIVHCITS